MNIIRRTKFVGRNRHEEFIPLEGSVELYRTAVSALCYQMFILRKEFYKSSLHFSPI